MFSATDVANFLACEHTATLALAELRGELKRPVFNDPSIELLQTLGLEHERQYLKHLIENEHRALTSIDTDLPWAQAVAQTTQALERGDQAIYQATFLRGQWRGRADFLIRVEEASDLGSWSYEAIDTKLARSTKAGAILQLCFYSDLLSRIQGREPEAMHVVLGGTNHPESFPVQRYIAYYRRIRDEYELQASTGAATYPEPADHCDVCSWNQPCDKRRHDDDHLSLIAGISRNQRKALVARSLTSLAGFASLTLPLFPKIEGIGKAALTRIHEQARLQVKGREEGHICYELLPCAEPGLGLAGLPLPSPGDIFFDLEANPYVLDQGLEYLFGFLTLSGETEPTYHAYWSSTRAQEKAAFEKFVGYVMDRRRQFPDLHIYHYAPYEQTALKRLAGRHACCVEELDDLLRDKTFVDLYRVFRQGVRASVESYSIKRLEPLYQFERKVPLRQANLALNSYEATMALGGDAGRIEGLLKTVEGYNQDDCFSAWKLRDWLEGRRIEWEQCLHQDLPRPEAVPEQPGLDLAAAIDQVAELKRHLTEILPADENQWTDNQKACWLLAQMLDWHRREDKSMWWEYFRLLALSDDELQEDRNALGGLAYQGAVGTEKRSTIHRYTFPPQDHAIKLGKDIRDPRTQKSPGEIVALDDLNHAIDIKRESNSSKPHPFALIPHKYFDKDALEARLVSLGSWVAANSIAAPGEYQAARSLLLRCPPPLPKDLATPIGEDGQLTEPASTLLQSLSAAPAVLPIQGPPGSGKTFTGARMVVELIRQGRRVGISAVSHKVIAGFLRAICEAADANHVPLRAIQKINSEDDACGHRLVNSINDNDAVRDSLADGSAQLAAGTIFLWARPDMERSVDVLFIDEAGQMSLANTLAIAQAATSIVLLGDPQQLDQPQRGIHPAGAEVSALGHLLNGRKTIGEDQGLFLAETRRLHPDVCKFTSEIFYDNRLKPRPENTLQSLNVEGPLGGTGLRFAPVKHAGNQNESPEEIEKVAALTALLVRKGHTWTDKQGAIHPITVGDILVVTPYNAQVEALIAVLPSGAEVGTVDKFQGRQAPVVIYSMATSTPDDAPRGMEFLYSMNRLNVATSRAQCVAVIVANPALFRIQCKTPRQIELANSFARYLELATLI